MNQKNEPRKDTPEKENQPEVPHDTVEQEHTWWKSVKYPDPPYESER